MIGVGVFLASHRNVRMESTATADLFDTHTQFGRGPSRQVLFWLLVCFTCSGMSGLIYEVAWVRSLELIFGATTFAVATVLAAFMGGLACGSYSMGRLAGRFEKFHPLRVYGAIELLIGLVAILIPLSFRAMVPIYQYVWKLTHASFITFSLIRFILSALILLVPTFLMGATLPIVSSFVGREPTLGKRRIGLLYTFNTLGAVLGCVGAGLILFPTIGLARTQWVAVAFNIVAAFGALVLSSRRTRSTAVLSPEESRGEGNGKDASASRIAIGSSVGCESALPPLSTSNARLLVTIYAFSGFVAHWVHRPMPTPSCWPHFFWG